MNKILKNAPGKGFVIACLTEKLIFTSYEIRDDVFYAKDWDSPDFTRAEECHFFDEEKEYRIIYRSARKDRIETILTAKEEEVMEPDLIYTEEVLVKPTYAEKEGLPSKLKIINRYRYSEHDTIVLEDYRISYPKSE